MLLVVSFFFICGQGCILGIYTPVKLDMFHFFLAVLLTLENFVDNLNFINRIKENLLTIVNGSSCKMYQYYKINGEKCC